MFRGLGNERRRACVVAVAVMMCALCYMAGCKEEAESGQAAEVKAAAVDVGFLVEGCVGSGIGEEACKCAGAAAKRDLGAALLDKMRAAPADDDPALEGYYTGEEIRAVMAWVEAASDECGIEDEG